MCMGCTSVCGEWVLPMYGVYKCVGVGSARVWGVHVCGSGFCPCMGCACVWEWVLPVHVCVGVGSACVRGVHMCVGVGFAHVMRCVKICGEWVLPVYGVYKCVWEWVLPVYGVCRVCAGVGSTRVWGM